jgi:hypothetical protein
VDRSGDGPADNSSNTWAASHGFTAHERAVVAELSLCGRRLLDVGTKPGVLTGLMHRSPRRNAADTDERQAGGMTQEVLDLGAAPRRPSDQALRRLSRQTLGVRGLLDRRPDLRGVVTWSEEIAESVLWSA